MKKLIIVNAAIWLILTLTRFFGNRLGFDGDALQEALVLPGSFGDYLSHPWTLLSYMFTQTNFLHLLFNLLWLYWFWRILSVRYTAGKILSIYLFGGIAGGLCWLISGISGILLPGAYLCGASASLLAMMGVAMTAMGGMRLNLMLFGEVKLRWFALVCILLTFFGGSTASSGTFAAHLGGAVYGVAYALMTENKIFPQNIFTKEKERFLRLFKRERTRQRRKAEDFTAANVENFVAAGKGRLADHRRLDELLDKIRLSGYASLSPAEKRELNAISSKLK